MWKILRRKEANITIFIMPINNSVNMITCSVLVREFRVNLSTLHWLLEVYQILFNCRTFYICTAWLKVEWFEEKIQWIYDQKKAHVNNLSVIDKSKCSGITESVVWETFCHDCACSISFIECMFTVVDIRNWNILCWLEIEWDTPICSFPRAEEFDIKKVFFE